MRWFEYVFAKSELMIVAAFMGIVGSIVATYMNIKAAWEIYGTIQFIFIGLLLIALLIFYKLGETNCQKMLSGALLMVCVEFRWMEALDVFGFGNALIQGISLAMGILTTIVFINHLLMQVDHIGNRSLATINSVILCIMVILQIIRVVNVITHPEILDQMFGDNVWAKKAAFYDWLALLGTNFVVVCMEARIQKYKARRFVAKMEHRWDDQEKELSKKIFRL